MPTMLTPTERRLGMFMEHEAMEKLVQCAVDNVFYVGMGKVLARDLAAQFSLTVDEAEKRLAKMAVKLVDHIREMVG